MATAEELITPDRRERPKAVRCGRRWRDDADLAPAVEAVLLEASRDVHALRDLHGWSQQEMATAAGISAQALSNLEKMRDDFHISTLVRLAYVAGFEVAIRFRRAGRAARI